MASRTNRAKFGYLNYNEIIDRINSGELTSFDIVYTKDTHETILITPELELLSLKSKVYCYTDIAAAESQLNKSTDTYAGQIVSILVDDIYIGYIVNQTSKGVFYVSPLSSKNNVDLDYNTLGNKPIINLIGTYDNPILIESLNNGIYCIKGQYIISNKIETVYLATSGDLFIVEIIEDVIYVKKITSKEIIDYVIDKSSVTKTTIATTAYIESCGYATEKYVNEKIAALNYITQEEVETYVSTIIENVVSDLIDSKIEEQVTEQVEIKVNEVLDEVLDTKIDQRIDERMQETEDDSILDLFS